jgi:hypothetical protein
MYLVTSVVVSGVESILNHLFALAPVKHFTGAESPVPRGSKPTGVKASVTAEFKDATML